MMLTSIQRTLVPLVIGYLVQLLALAHVTLTDDQAKVLGGLITAVIAALYYVAVRLVEQKFPWATVLLGSTKQPAAYSPDGSLSTPPVELVETASAGDLDSPEAIAADAAVQHDPSDL